MPSPKSTLPKCFKFILFLCMRMKVNLFEFQCNYKVGPLKVCVGFQKQEQSCHIASWEKILGLTILAYSEGLGQCWQFLAKFISETVQQILFPNSYLSFTGSYLTEFILRHSYLWSIFFICILLYFILFTGLLFSI